MKEENCEWRISGHPTKSIAFIILIGAVSHFVWLYCPCRLLRFFSVIGAEFCVLQYFIVRKSSCLIGRYSPTKKTVVPSCWDWKSGLQAKWVGNESVFFNFWMRVVLTLRIHSHKKATIMLRNRLYLTVTFSHTVCQNSAYAIWMDLSGIQITLTAISAPLFFSEQNSGSIYPRNKELCSFWQGLHRFAWENTRAVSESASPV